MTLVLGSFTFPVGEFLPGGSACQMTFRVGVWTHPPKVKFVDEAGRRGCGYTYFR